MIFFIKQRYYSLIKQLRYFSYNLEYMTSRNIRSKYPNKLKKILFVNHGALGDLFSSLKVINSIKLPSNCQVYFAVPEQYVKSLKYLDRQMDIKIISEDSLVNTSEYFDLGIIFSENYNLFKKYKSKIGYAVGKEYHSFSSSLRNLFSKRFNLRSKPHSIHKLYQEIAISRLAKLKIKNLNSFKLKNKSIFSKIQKKFSIRKKYVVLHCVGKNFSNIFKLKKIPNLCWDLKNFSQIAKYLSKTYGVEIILTGDESEYEIVENLKNMSGLKSKIHNLAGKLSIEELHSVIENSLLVISIDTSIIHIAELSETPLIALFGPTFPEEVGPIYKESIILHHPEKCVMDRKKGECQMQGNPCMNSISVSEVESAIYALLKINLHN